MHKREQYFNVKNCCAAFGCQLHLGLNFSNSIYIYICMERHKTEVGITGYFSSPSATEFSQVFFRLYNSKHIHPVSVCLACCFFLSKHRDLLISSKN